MITALVLITVERGRVPEAAQALLGIEGVTEVWSVTGDYDLVAMVRLKEYNDLADVVTAHMTKIPSITRTNTMMAFKVFSREDLEQAWDVGLA